MKTSSIPTSRSPEESFGQDISSRHRAGDEHATDDDDNGDEDDGADDEMTLSNL